MVLPSSRQLSHFLAVVDHGSLGRAARALNISEPALSKNIRLLEELLGVKLFDRGPRGLDLTTFGESLRDHAQVIVTELHRSVAEIQELKGTEVGHAYIGAGPAFATSIIPKMVAALLADRPGLRVTVVEGYTDMLVPLVLHGELDFAYLTLAASVPDAELVQEVLGADEVIVVARAGHPAAGQAGVTLEALAAMSWMLPKGPDLIRARVEHMFLAAGLVGPRPAIEYVSASFARAMLEEGDLLSALPESLVREQIERGSLVRVDAPGGVWRREVGIIRRRRGSLSPAARAMLAQLRLHADSGGNAALSDRHAQGLNCS